MFALCPSSLQYEVAFPVSSMADCVEEVLTHVYGPDLGNISNAIV
jgi:hypothetical protein